MNKLVLGIVVFLIIGGLMIKYDAQQNGGDFLSRYGNWVFHIGKNIGSLTSYTIKEYDWLPNTSLNTSLLNIS
ncbi:MAG: hypothetical protein AABX52_00380 [Nanoarchaeota archaeon]